MITDSPVILILAITYLPITFFLECRLFTYFGGGPGVNFAGLVVACACIGGSALFGMQAQKLKTAARIVSLYFKVLVTMVIVMVIVHPFDYDDLHPLAVVYKTVKAYTNYSTVSYSMLYAEGAGNDAFRVTALYKYRSKLPERSIIIHYFESEKTPNGNRRQLIFEQRNNQWKQFRVAMDDLRGDLSVKEAPGNETAEIYTFTINGRKFSEKYITDEEHVGAHFLSSESKWVDGQPRIMVSDWEGMPWKGFYRSYYKVLQKYKS